MSYPLLLTADKAEFINFLSDNIEVKKDSEVALTKATLSIPVFSQEEYLIPLINNADHNDNAFQFIIDGIYHNITWTEIHASYQTLNTATGIEGNLSIDDFYSGTYLLPFNNFIEFIDGANAVKSRPNICNILASAFNTKFKFYDIESAPKLNPTSISKISDRGGSSFTFNGNNYTTTPMQNVSMELGFRALYNPNKTLLQNTVVPMNTANNFEWTSVSGYTVDNTQATGATLTSNDGNDANLVNAACCNVGGAQIDPNGGYFSFRVSQMGAVPTGSHNHIMMVGLTQGLGNGVNVVPTNGLDEQSYVCGVKFSHNVDGGLVLSILDADGNLEPATEFNTFDLDNVFFIRLCRSTDANQLRQYNFSVWKNINDVWDNTTSLIFQSEINLTSPLDYYMTTSSNVTGMRIQDCKLVPLSLDSFLQLDTNSTTPIRDNTVFEFDTISLQPVTTTSNDIKIFYQELGVQYLTNQSNPCNSSLGNGYIYNYVIPRVSDEARVDYYIGVNSISDIFVESSVNVTPVIQGNNSVSTNEIPRTLELTIKDLNNTTYQPSNLGSNGNVESGNAITRVVGTILVPQEYLTKTNSFDMNISYEPYNLVYRKLYNQNNIPINQFNCKLGYKDFTNNVEKIIKRMNGVSKYEVNIKKCGNNMEY